MTESCQASTPYSKVVLYHHLHQLDSKVTVTILLVEVVREAPPPCQVERTRVPPSYHQKECQDDTRKVWVGNTDGFLIIWNVKCVVMHLSKNP